MVQGERYRTIPDEVVRYALGHYGKPLAPIAADVMDRIAASSAARQYAGGVPAPATVAEVRARFGGRISDDEVLLRIMFPEAHVEAMLGAPPIEGRGPGVDTPIVALVREAVSRRRTGTVSVERDGVRLSARFPAAARGPA